MVIVMVMVMVMVMLDADRNVALKHCSLCFVIIMQYETSQMTISVNIKFIFYSCNCLLPRRTLQKMLAIPINVVPKGSLVATHPVGMGTGADLGWFVIIIIIIVIIVILVIFIIILLDGPPARRRRGGF